MNEQTNAYEDIICQITQMYKLFIVISFEYTTRASGISTVSSQPVKRFEAKDE